MMHPLFLETSPLALWPIVVTLVVAAVAVYLLLPRPQPYPVLWGAAAGGLALFLVLFTLIRWGPFSVENVLFCLFAAGALGFGTLLVTQHDPARAALSFAMVVLSTCGLYLLQAAPFLMAATIIIYAGAIIVTFLFVLMLSQQHGLSSADYRSREGLLSTVAGFVLLGSLLYVLKTNYDTRPLDAVLQQIQEARAAGKARELLTDGDFERNAFDALRKVRPDAAVDLQSELRALLPPAAEGEPNESLGKVEQLLVRVRATTGDLQLRNLPPPYFTSPFSNANRTVDSSVAIVRAPDGSAPMPAENVVALGRSLFTDYLLSVELGGTLLLVATIGAIAITGRRGERSI